MASSNKGIKFSKGPFNVDFTFPFVRLRSLKKGEYDPSSKTFICCKFDDFCDCHIFKGSKLVFTDFIF